MNKVAERYLRAVRKALHCPGRQGKRLLRQLSEDIEEYCEEHPDATEEELCRRFGTPEDVAAAFVEDLGGSIAVNVQRRRNRIVTAVIVVLVLVAGVVTARQIWIQQLLLDFHWVESITYEADELPEYTGTIYWEEVATRPPVFPKG